MHSNEKHCIFISPFKVLWLKIKDAQTYQNLQFSGPKARAIQIGEQAGSGDVTDGDGGFYSQKSSFQ